MVRFKNRYLLTEWRWHDGRVDESLTESVIVGILRQCVAVNFGDIGAGAALSSVAVKYWIPRRAWAWFDGRDVHREVWCCMTLLRDVKGRSVTVRVLHNGGTLRSSQAAALRHSKEAYERMEKTGLCEGTPRRRGARRRRGRSTLSSRDRFVVAIVAGREP